MRFEAHAHLERMGFCTTIRTHGRLRILEAWWWRRTWRLCYLTAYGRLGNWSPLRFSGASDALPGCLRSGTPQTRKGTKGPNERCPGGIASMLLSNVPRMNSHWSHATPGRCLFAFSLLASLQVQFAAKKKGMPELLTINLGPRGRPRDDRGFQASSMQSDRYFKIHSEQRSTIFSRPRPTAALW